MTLDGKIALITGGSRGIGAAIARAMLEAGARTVICAREEGELLATASTLRAAKGGDIVAKVCDVRELSQVQSMVEEIVAIAGGLDILVNNAGVGHLAPFDELTPEQWHETIATNLTGVFNCCYAAVPAMKSRGGGQIVNISSRSGMNPFSEGTAYCASKFGLNGFSEALHLDLRRYNIRVSYIMPGRVGTDFAGETPRPWHLKPEDVAKCVLDVVTHDPGAVASRVELRPAEPEP